MRWPDQFNGGQDISQPTIAMDLTATMLAAAGRLDPSMDLDESNLLPLFENEQTIKPLFWRYGSMWATRHGKWKYVLDNGTQFLFDLENDIGERNNLFSRYPETALALREALIEWNDSLVAP